MMNNVSKAQVLAEELVRIASSLACDCVEVRHTRSDVDVTSAKLGIKRMRNFINQIEGILEAEAENNV